MAGGGGILSSGSLVIDSSTISGNSVSVGNGAGGGGIAITGGTANLTNITISGNTAVSNAADAPTGGGIFLLAPATIQLENVTIVDNTASKVGGGISFVGTTARTSFRNTLIANNVSQDGSTGQDVGASQAQTFTSNGHNLIEAPKPNSGFSNGVNFDIVGIDPDLGILKNNGGQTDTYDLRPGSPAINTGDNCVANGTCIVNPTFITSDQRGTARPQGPSVDIGAFEYNLVHFTVTEFGPLTTDGVCDSNCTLLDALNLSNANPDENVIDFLPSVFNSARMIGLAGFGELNIVNPVTILGPSGGLVISANLASRVLNVHSGVNVTMSNLTVTQGRSTSAGAGLINAGTLTLKGVTFTDNATTSFSSGGALYNTGAMTIVNSTISGNNSFTYGGGIGNVGTLTLVNVTLSQNHAQDLGGGVQAFSGSTTNLVNSIIGGNTAGAGSPDVAGTFISQGHNFIGRSDGSAGFTYGNNGDQVGTIALPKDPMLGPLVLNGGPTATRALLPGSTAINGGDNAAAASAGLTTDQRGIARPQGANVDIGAFEYVAPTAAGVSISGRVTDAYGRAISGVLVSLVLFDGTVRTVTTNTFGHFRFDEITAGQSVLLSATARRYTFDSQVLSLEDNITDIQLIPR